MGTFIYALIDPRTEQIRYVGKSNNPRTRITKHFYDCEIDHSHAANWIRQLKRNGLRPIVKILEEVSQDNWQEAERRWIKELRRKFNLTNSTDGGDGVSNPPPEVREKISKARKGHKHTPEAIEKMRKASVGHKMPREAVERIAKALRGRKHPKEFGEHISKAKKGKPGRKWSREEKAYLSRVNSKLTKDDVREIRKLLANGTERKVIASQYGVGYSTIRSIAVGISHRFTE